VGIEARHAPDGPQSARAAIEVVLVCRAELLLLGLERLLSREPDLRVLTYTRLPEPAAGGRPAGAPPRVALLSDRLAPDITSDCARARETVADEVVLLWGTHDVSALVGCMAAGARGFVMEGDPGGVLAAAIRSAVRHETFMGPRTLDLLVDWLAAEERSRSDAAHRRDGDLLRLLAEGRSTADIGERMGIATKTVRNRLSALYRRLGVSSRSAAVQLAEQRGLLDRD
jgi:DNA-binding NarL/FixJ family response regulator